MSFAISSADLERFASSSNCRYSFQEQPPFFLFRAIKKLGLSRLRLQPKLDQPAVGFWLRRYRALLSAPAFNLG